VLALTFVLSLPNFSAISDEKTLDIEDPLLRPRHEVEVVFYEGESEYQAKSIEVVEQ
jgi:hypothetical protein